MRTRGCIATLIVGAVLALGAGGAVTSSLADTPGATHLPAADTTPQATPPSTTAPTQTPTTTAPSQTPTTTAPTQTPTTTAPTQTPTAGGSPCGLTSGGLVCPGNPSCVVNATGVTCANNCTVTSVGLVCPRGGVLGNPPVTAGPKHQRKSAVTHPPSPAAAGSPKFVAVVQRTGAARELPFTGAPLLPLLGLGLVLIAGGVLLLRTTSTAGAAGQATGEGSRPVVVPPCTTSRRPSRSKTGLVLVALLLLRHARR